MRQVSPKLQPWLFQFKQQAAALIQAGFKSTPTNAREYLAGLTRAMVQVIPAVPLIYDDLIQSPEFMIPVRIYVPQPDKKLPVLMYYHGGGHMTGSVSVYDPICRKLALATSHIVVAVDYRLAPENPFPAGFKDCYWAAKNLWPVLRERKLNFLHQLSLGGDSAGGAMTAMVIGRAQFEHDWAVKKAVMIYPALDFTLSMPSVEENAVGYFLHTSRIVWYYENFFRNGEDRYALSPLFGRFSKKLPPVFMATAEFCPLRDEDLAYLKKLEQAGVQYTHLHFADMIHAFINLESLVPTECHRLYQAIGQFLNQE